MRVISTITNMQVKLMDYKIDLKELSIRESEKVEWKKNGDDEDIARKFDRRSNPNVGEADIDMLLFRDCMNEMNLSHPLKPLEDYFSDREQIAEFVPPLCVRKPLDGELCLRNFTLFMFGKKPWRY